MNVITTYHPFIQKSPISIIEIRFGLFTFESNISVNLFQCLWLLPSFCWSSLMPIDHKLQLQLIFLEVKQKNKTIIFASIDNTWFYLVLSSLEAFYQCSKIGTPHQFLSHFLAQRRDLNIHLKIDSSPFRLNIIRPKVSELWRWNRYACVWSNKVVLQRITLVFLQKSCLMILISY